MGIRPWNQEKIELLPFFAFPNSRQHAKASNCVVKAVDSLLSKEGRDEPNITWKYLFEEACIHILKYVCSSQLNHSIILNIIYNCHKILLLSSSKKWLEKNFTEQQIWLFLCCRPITIRRGGGEKVVKNGLVYCQQLPIQAHKKATLRPFSRLVCTRGRSLQHT